MLEKTKSKFWSATQLHSLLEVQRSQHVKQFMFTPFKQSLKLVVKNLRLQSKNKRGQISAAWGQIQDKIGLPILKDTEIISFRSGILKVAVPGQSQLFEVEHFHKDEIIQKLREYSNYTIVKITFELKR